MSKIQFVAIFIVVIKCATTAEDLAAIQARLAVLKSQMRSQIKKGQFGSVPNEDQSDPFETPLRLGPITPVSRLRNKKRKTTEAKPTVTSEITTNIDNLTTAADLNVLTHKPLLRKPVSRTNTWAKYLKKFGTGEIFYRRDTRLNKELTEAEIKQRHALLCTDLLRPIIKGLKKNGTTKIVSDQTANRLIQLLSYGNVQSPEEIESILYQINNLHLRFFQWEVSAIKKLFNFLMPNQKHSFKFLKYGVKRILFDLWHMDLSDTAVLIKESRMFRPPCIGTSQGSTRTSLNPQYITKPNTPKSTCAPKDTLCRKDDDSSTSFEE